nr:DNA/RNA polymerases superfamily protein [Tanacetum cinerariifolium]
FEMLYGRKCRALIYWDQVGERVIEGPEMIEVTNEKVDVTKEKLKEARTRQKSYADKHRRSIEGYKYHPLHVISYPPDQIRTDLSYVKEPEAILDRQDRVMRNKTIPFV